MEHKKTKIVLDADVIIHFMEANYFSILPDIFPEYEYLILDVVYNEISQNSGTKDFIDKYLHFFHKLLGFAVLTFVIQVKGNRHHITFFLFRLYNFCSG